MSGYYAWRTRPPGARKMANDTLVARIRAVQESCHHTYGSPRMVQALRQAGERCGVHRVARLMRQHGLGARYCKRSKARRASGREGRVAPNLLRQDFTATRPNQKWVSDITVIPTAEGDLYLAYTQDLFARLVVGWSMGTQMTTALAERSLAMGLARRDFVPGEEPPIHHSDQGSQYTSHTFQALLEQHGLTSSMSRAGHCYDNAAGESFFASLKAERVNHQRYRTQQEARTDIFLYIEVFYNRQRLHSSLDYVSPEDYERRYYERQKG